MATPGFRIKLHQSLISTILIAGAPRRFFILNSTVCVALALGMHLYYMLLLGLGLHIVAVVLAKKDPLFFEIILRYFKQKKYYDV